MDLILEEAASFLEILSDPAPSIVISDVGDTYVSLKARVWMADPSRSEFNRLRTDYVTNVARRFGEVELGQDPDYIRLFGELDVTEQSGGRTTPE